MRFLRYLRDRLDGSVTTVVERYEVEDEPDIPVWRAASDGRQMFMRAERAEVEFRRYGKGPWRFRSLTFVGRIVGTGLHGPHTIRRRRDVPEWALPCLTPPEDPVLTEGSDR